MKSSKLIKILAGAGMILLSSSQANATVAEGLVLCDTNQSGSIDAGDLPLNYFGYTPVVDIVDSIGGGAYTATTTSDGTYYQILPDTNGEYAVSLDPSTLPADAAVIQPSGGVYACGAHDMKRTFLVESQVCVAVVAEDKCWLTGGGVKFSQITSTLMAERGPKDTLGGNVFPSCDSSPGNGGNWNHVSHSSKLHFKGTTINTVRCGNVPGITSGSESPVTPYNFIEFSGTGSLKGIKGNKVNHQNIYFFARAEDRNEPGSNGASDGDDVDRYYLHVFSDLGDPNGTTLMLIDGDGTSTTVDPITITGGNLQLHISSCDTPPQ